MTVIERKKYSQGPDNKEVPGCNSFGISVLQTHLFDFMIATGRGWPSHET